MTGVAFTREGRDNVFTQCSKCETVFELSADVLREAGGQVRCGHCGEIFNAFARLAEDDSAFQIGESQYDLESRADAILEGSAAAPALAGEDTSRNDYSDDGMFDDDARLGVEIAHLQFLDEDEATADDEFESDEQSDPDDDTIEDDPAIFEFTLPPGELDRIFVESKGVPLIALPPGLRPLHTDRPLAPVTALPIGESAARQRHFPAAPPLLTAATPASAALRTAAALRASASGLSAPDQLRLEMLAGAASRNARAALLELEQTPARSSVGWWIAAVALCLLLALQMLHENRESLAGVGVFGPAVRAVYSKLGSDVALPLDLDAYQLRQWGVSAAPDSGTTLRVRASIMNVSSQLKPYPLLRVILADRFGAKLGTRNFEPAEYTGKNVVRQLSPGERVDATVDILDPGQEAEGFELNVCLRAADKTVSCAGDNVAARKP